MFEKLLSEDSSWEYFKNTALPIICYGTGNGADKVLNEFNRLNIKISGFTASNEFVRKRTFRDFTVKSLNDCENEFGDFTVAVCFGSQLPDVINNIKYVSKKHKTIVPCVPVYGDNIFNKDFFKANIKDIEKAYSLLSDEKSKEVCYNLIKFQLSGKLEYLFDSESDKTEALNDILNLESSRSYLDLGAYKGDTIEEYLKFCKNKYDKIIAVEPDKKTFSKLQLNTEEVKNITLLNVGIWKEKSAVPFLQAGGRNSSIEFSKKSPEITSESVDSILDGESIDYIKADIEGAELDMLCGAENTLKNYKPKLNIAAYHRAEDIFKLILKINELNPEYKIYIRHHPYIPAWDTNLYCV